MKYKPYGKLWEKEMMKEKTKDNEKVYDIQKSKKAQNDKCEGKWQFAPQNGVCWNCNNNIYEPKKHETQELLSCETIEYIAGITVKEAGEKVITGCPHCHYSFCR